MTNRRRTDVFFKYLFGAVALFSVLALGAILIFVFVQGFLPFIVPTAKGIHIVPQRIDAFTLNGVFYENQTTFIELPKNTSLISIRFPLDEGETGLDIAINNAEKDPQKKLNVMRNDGAKISYPESYVYTASWPGMIASLEKRMHIILPEPGYNAAKFLGGTDWRPSRDKVYGVFPMIAGTLLASLGAVLLGVPVGLLCALFMAEFLPSKPAALIRSGIELLAGIPSVVYGFFGLMVIVPAVKKVFHIPSGSTLLSAVIVLSLMILPTIITIAETSLRAVPSAMREASLAVGASKMQTAWNVVLPHAHSGVIAGVILGISRAVGETMAVIMVAGNSPQLIHSPLQSVRTLTATIAMEMGYSSGRHHEMLFSIGVVLFVIILILNSLILWFRRRMESEI
jgi:phosphate transport system permease protein